MSCINPIYLIMSLLLIATTLFSQTTQDSSSNSVKIDDPFEAGILLGGSNAYGDLVDATLLKVNQTNITYGAFFRYQASRNISVRANVLRGKLSGSDDDSETLSQRGYSFESSFTEVTVVGEYDLFGKRRFSKRGRMTPIFSPYVFVGIGVALTQPSPDFADDEGNIAPLAQQDLDNEKTTHFSVPIGAGIKMDINKQITLGAEFGMRPVFNDYLDGLSMAGNPDRNDWYSVGGLTLAYRFASKDSDNDGIADKRDPCPTLSGAEGMGGCPDTDGDGLADRDDKCPTTFGNERAQGCPDADDDGVPDHDDRCVNEPGSEAVHGCPDRDHDGVADHEDQCPDLPGSEEFSGCRDTDRDGIWDTEDQCPYEKGVAEFHGCPIPDRDGDGVLNHEDNCPDKPGTINGCPDTDGDGLTDDVDDCPDLSGPQSNKGCPELSEADKELLRTAIDDVKFNTSSYTLISTSYPVLKQIGDLLKRYPTYYLVIDGFTDNRGNDFANQQLSEYRAQACANYLHDESDIEEERMIARGFGETRPRSNNDSASGRRQNRRVEFTLVSKDELQDVLNNKR